MTTNHMNLISRNKDIASVFIITAALLMIPLVAMQISENWDWKPFDFIVVGTLFIGTGLLAVLAKRKIKITGLRIIVILAILMACLLIYAELAVGIFGSPFAGS